MYLERDEPIEKLIIGQPIPHRKAAMINYLADWDRRWKKGSAEPINDDTTNL
jgi:hypothetical protein